MRLCLLMVATVLIASPLALEAQDKRDQAVRADKQEFSENDSWIYDDLDQAIAVAKETKRPLMVVFR